MPKLTKETVGGLARRVADFQAAGVDIVAEQKALADGLASGKLTVDMIAGSTAKIQKLTLQRNADAEYLASVLRTFVAGAIVHEPELILTLFSALKNHVSNIVDVLNASRDEAKEKRETAMRDKIVSEANRILAQKSAK